MCAKVAVNFGQGKFKFYNQIVKSLPKSALTVLPYNSLSQIEKLEKYGVFKIKPEKLEEY